MKKISTQKIKKKNDEITLPTKRGELTKILVLLSIKGEKVYAYSGVQKKDILLEELGTSKNENSYILISSEEVPKSVTFIEGALPIFNAGFTKATADEVTNILGKALPKDVYIAKISMPEIIDQTFTKLWSGEMILNYENNRFSNIKKSNQKKEQFLSKGNPENIKQSLDGVKLRKDLDGKLILSIEGWVFSDVHSEAYVDLFLDGKKINSTVANKIRPDVLDFYKVNRLITPGYFIENKIMEKVPNTIGLLLTSGDDCLSLRFPFDNIPGAKELINFEETVFKFSDDEPLSNEDHTIYDFFRQRRNYKYNNVKVSVVIPTKLATLNIFELISEIKSTTENVQIVVVGHGISEDEQKNIKTIADKYIHVVGKFNWSKFNNKAATICDGEVIVFLNDDVFPINPHWKSCVLDHLSKGEGKIVLGARLVGKDLRIQHDGISIYGAVTNHVGVGGIKFDQYKNTRKVDATTGAFMALKKEYFDRLRGFDEKLDVIGNDLDFCLKVGADGGEVLIPNDLIFFHAEGSSRANLKENNYNEILEQRLPSSGRLRALDLNRELDVSDEKISIIRRKSIAPKTIALIKIDHIGDFYSAIPGFVKVREAFPSSKISLICSPEIKEIADGLTLFDEIYPLRVFNKISGKGLEFKKIPRVLLERKFDVVADYRKHEDARIVFDTIKSNYKFCFKSGENNSNDNFTINYSGHTEKKGVDFLPSVTNELVGFSAYWIDVINSMPENLPLSEVVTNRRTKAKHKNKNLRISIFPLSGNTARAYPLSLYMEYAILEKLRNPDYIIAFYIPSDQMGEYMNIDSLDMLSVSGVEVLGLNKPLEMVDVIKKSDLVVTNNTGPMWIASQEKVPCIAVFSGVVSKTHWLPAGVIQLSRSVTCTPCYISTAEHCHRSMYCLRSIDPSYINLLTDYLL